MRKLLDRCDTETDSLILGELDIAKILSEGRFKMTDGNKKERNMFDNRAIKQFWQIIKRKNWEEL